MLDYLREELSRQLGPIAHVKSGSGGDTCDAYHVTTRGHADYFVKVQRANGLEDMLSLEARSLAFLRGKSPLIVPRVMAQGEVDGSQYLALQFLRPKRPDDSDWKRFGTSLARLHTFTAPQFGMEWPTYVGKWLQDNRRTDDWITFYRDQRLAPLMSAVAYHFAADTIKKWDALLKRLEDLLTPGPPTLVHGDLWSGNVHFSDRGPGIVDPSSFFGHREMDLAMMQLFGGIPAVTFDAYGSEFPTDPGIQDRIWVYQFFYLLLHVYMFGKSYVPSVERVLGRVY